MKLCGVVKIDNQHAILFDTIIRARSLVESNQFIALLEVLGKLENYIYLHFHDEELFMRENNIPGIAEHLVEHEQFKAVVHHHLETLSKDGEPSLRILDFAENWVSSHVDAEVELFRKYANT